MTLSKLIDTHALDHVVTSYTEDVTSIRANTKLSEEGRRDRLATAYVEHLAAYDHLIEQARAIQAARVKELESQLAGVDQTHDEGTAERSVVEASYRDAYARASTTEDRHHLEELMTQGLRTGDRTLARAALFVAVDRGDLHTLNRYLEDHPDEELPLQELFEVRSPLAISDELTFFMKYPRPSAPFTNALDVGLRLGGAQPTALVERALEASQRVANGEPEHTDQPIPTNLRSGVTTTDDLNEDPFLRALKRAAGVH